MSESTWDGTCVPSQIRERNRSSYARLACRLAKKMASIGQVPATAVTSSQGGISLPNTGNTGVFTSISTSGMPLTLGGNITGNSSFSAAATSGSLGSILQTSISGTSAQVLNPTNTLNPSKTQISGLGSQGGGFLLNTSGIGGSSVSATTSVKATAVTTTTTQESGTLQGVFTSVLLYVINNGKLYIKLCLFMVYTCVIFLIVHIMIKFERHFIRYNLDSLF